MNLCNANKYWKKPIPISGDIYEACPRRDLTGCTFVVKEVPYDYDNKYDLLAMKLNIGPFIEILKCHKSQYIVQEKLDITLTDYLEKHILTKTLLQKINKLVLETIYKMHIFHNDLHSDNIMLRKNGDPVLIDYETAVYIPDIGKKKFNILLKRNSFLRLISKEKKEETNISILSDENIDKIQKDISPKQEMTKKQLQNQQKIRKSKELARLQMLQRTNKLLKKKKNIKMKITTSSSNILSIKQIYRHC